MAMKAMKVMKNQKEMKAMKAEPNTCSQLIPSLNNMAAAPEIVEKAYEARILPFLLGLLTGGLEQSDDPSAGKAHAAKLLQKKLAGKKVDEETLLAAASFLCDKARAHWLEEDRYVDDITATVVHFSKRADAAVNGNGRGGPAPSGAMNGGGKLSPKAKPSGPTATPFGVLDSKAGGGGAS